MLKQGISFVRWRHRLLVMLGFVLLVNLQPLYAKNTKISDLEAGEALELSVLDTRPNVLHGIDGLHQGRVPLGTVSPNTLKTFVKIIDLVRREYVTEVNDEELFKNAISGMLGELDANAEFLGKTAFDNLQSFTAGNVAALGVDVRWRNQDEHWVVVSVEDGSPAAKMGITQGDYLHQIGDIKLNDTHSVNDITQMMSGIAGTQVDISYSRAGRNRRTVTLQRTQMMKTHIETHIYQGVAVVKVPVFQNVTRASILEALTRANIPIQGIVLDVRNNPGGVLESAGEVASLFMKNQVVAKVASRQGVDRVLNTEGSPLLEEIPLIILQNRYSASAAEVLASSLQAHKRALIVGETSYGKGSVQSVIPIGDGQAVKLTTAHYLTAKDKVIDGVGVTPDVSFDMTEHADHQDAWLTQAVALMEQGKLAQGVKLDFIGSY